MAEPRLTGDYAADRAQIERALERLDALQAEALRRRAPSLSAVTAEFYFPSSGTFRVPHGLGRVPRYVQKTSPRDSELTVLESARQSWTDRSVEVEATVSGGGRTGLLVIG